jgi:ribosomal protein S18 acetylase RimI-like enzyme
MRSLERQGLVVSETSARDRRVRRARLTEAGLAERRELDRRSDELAWSLLEPLGERQRAALTDAMATVERLLDASLVAISIEDPASPDARRCERRYYDELAVRFESGFDPARSGIAEPSEVTPPAGLLLLARLRGEPVGCGGFRLRPGRVAELKRMWIDPRVRGLGVGRRLLRELEAEALRAGATTARLETSGSLAEAVSLYRSAGYEEVERFNDEPYAEHWFAKRLARARPGQPTG